jgi:D-ribose pyranase
MRRSGLLHAELNRVIAAMGHTDTLVIADIGLPVPPGVPCIDLAVLPGVPGFAQVFEAIWAELAVEAVTFAEEIHGHNDAMASLGKRLAGDGIAVKEISHALFNRAHWRALTVCQCDAACRSHLLNLPSCNSRPVRTVMQQPLSAPIR